MPQSIDEVLAGAKKTLAEASEKFPSPAPAAKPSYQQVPPARKAAAGLGAELSEKAKMIEKGREALK